MVVEEAAVAAALVAPSPREGHALLACSHCWNTRVSCDDGFRLAPQALSRQRDAIQPKRNVVKVNPLFVSPFCEYARAALSTAEGSLLLLLGGAMFWIKAPGADKQSELLMFRR